jgi:hypothetical protein
MTEKDAAVGLKPGALSFECDGCGQLFESWERLRQHQIDCQGDDLDGPL